MSQLKLTADSGGGTVAIKGPASTTGNAALEMTVPSTASSTLDSLNRAGNILQVVQAVKTDNASLSVSQGSIVDLAGAGVGNLSPQMAVSKVGNKVLIIPNISLSGISGGLRITFTVGGSVSTFIGDAAGSRQRVSLEGRSGSDSNSNTYTGLFLYTPSNTNNTTYGVAVSHADNATHTLRINGANTGDHNYNARSASSITLMEVAA